MNPEWRKTFYGWTACCNGYRLSVQRYVGGNGSKAVYVARVDGHPATSCAMAHKTSAQAKQEALRIYEHINKEGYERTRR